MSATSMYPYYIPRNPFRSPATRPIRHSLGYADYGRFYDFYDNQSNTWRRVFRTPGSYRR